MEKYGGERGDRSEDLEKSEEFEQAMYPTLSIGQLTVPDYLIKHTINNMPTDTVFWLDPETEDIDKWGDKDTWANIFVNQDKRLMLDGSSEVKREMARPDSVAGKIGVMAVSLTESALRGDQNRLYLVDLRFASADALKLIDTEDVPDDQEDANEYYRWIKNIFPADGFILRSGEPEYDMDDEDCEESDIADLPYDKFGSTLARTALDSLALESEKQVERIEDEREDKLAEDRADAKVAATERVRKVLNGELTPADRAKFYRGK